MIPVFEMCPFTPMGLIRWKELKTNLEILLSIKLKLNLGRTIKIMKIYIFFPPKTTLKYILSKNLSTVCFLPKPIALWNQSHNTLVLTLNFQ